MVTVKRIKTIWYKMKDRCYNPKSNNYKYYGGRGISICNEWLNSFDAFNNWAISNGYSDELSIDRIETNGNYGPDNCKWANRKEQQANRRDNIHTTIDGKKYTPAQLSELTGKSYAASYQQVKKLIKKSA